MINLEQESEKDMSNNLVNEIRALQKLKREGEYWDFKKEWSDNKGDLLHDIICMANNLSGHNGYIIIGIDEENDFCVVDVTSDLNRKNSQNIVDFLSTKHFAGDVRPFAYVETVVIDNKSIDVIIVISDNNVPYYLKERYENVSQNNIYIRVGDTNTPINKSADITYVEKLWRRRFGIDLVPIERLKVYLKDTEDWIELYSGNGYYYRRAPEFRILEKQDSIRTAYEYYMFSQTNTTPHWHIAHVYYHQTPIEEILCNLLDGGRLFVTVPDWRNLKTNSMCSFFYRSYTKDSIKWLLNNVFIDNNADAQFAMNILLSCVLVFENEKERSDFEKYVINIYDKNKADEYESRIPSISEVPNGRYKDQLTTDYKNALYLMDLLDNFRLIKLGINI